MAQCGHPVAMRRLVLDHHHEGLAILTFFGEPLDRKIRYHIRAIAVDAPPAVGEPVAAVLRAGAFHPVLSIVSGAAMVLVTWMGAVEVMEGRISLGDFVAFGSLMTTVDPHVYGICDASIVRPVKSSARDFVLPARGIRLSRNA